MPKVFRDAAWKTTSLNTCGGHKSYAKSVQSVAQHQIPPGLWPSGGLTRVRSSTPQSLREGFTPPYNPSPGPKTDGVSRTRRCQYLMDCISFCCFFVSVVDAVLMEPAANINFIRAHGRHRNLAKR